MSTVSKPTIVFCHGIWADGSCFSKVIPALQADGYEVIAVQYGLDLFEEDCGDGEAHTQSCWQARSFSSAIRMAEPPSRAAGTDERVVGLVYIAAVAPDAGETVQDQLDKYPSDIFSRVEVADGRAWMLPNGTEFFAGDLSEEDQKLVWATHYAPVYNLFQQQKLSADIISRGGRSQAGTFWPRKTTPCIPTCNAGFQSAWERLSPRWRAAMCRCSPSLMSSST